jgi:hypothetical protein
VVEPVGRAIAGGRPGAPAEPRQDRPDRLARVGQPPRIDEGAVLHAQPSGWHRGRRLLRRDPAYCGENQERDQAEREAPEHGV